MSKKTRGKRRRWSDQQTLEILGRMYDSKYSVEIAARASFLPVEEVKEAYEWLRVSRLPGDAEACYADGGGWAW